MYSMYKKVVRNMSAKIINPDMYKKTTRKKVAKSKAAQKNSLKYRKEKLKNIKENKKYEKDNFETFNNNSYISGNRFNTNFNFDFNYEEEIIFDKNKHNKKSESGIKTFFKVIALVLCIGVIGVVSRIIVKHENEVVVTTDSTPYEKVTLVQNYDFKIGMSKLDTIDYMKSKNIVLNELVKLSNNSLLSVNKDYTINYKVAKYVEKMSPKEYFIKINSEYDVSVDDIVNSVDNLKSLGEESIYYNTVNNIESITKQADSAVKITLKNDNNYFLYELDFPLVANSKGSSYNISSEENSVLLTNENSKSTLKTIRFTGYSDSDNLISDFRNMNIDMFTASSDSNMQLIGKHDYNVKKYRDGETIFLFGNKDSLLFSRKEVRQALAYSLNRDEIVKEVNSSFSEVIDIPYIYSDIKIKYDVYGAQNALLSQGWQKIDGVYKKEIDDEQKVIELNLLVNENDATKIKIAEKIKEMAEINGIKININKQKDEALQEHINNKNYDIILADVYINNNPNISFIQEYININNEINTAINMVNESNIENLPKNIATLQNLLSSEIACIGILARNTSVVYQKNINGFYDIGYMKLFDNIEKIGKIQEIKSDIE